ncbi:hypothetical protein AX16_003692 [Volvariella volvacea WC 439]|nr:hypothetical protein AX16_003692 [Volvariella volvacea WC 439]
MVKTNGLDFTSPMVPQLTGAAPVIPTSPMSTLLPELLSEVFQHCTDTTSPIIPSSKHAPLLLTRVCRQWRDVACSTPRLWTALRIFIGPSGPCRERLTAMWLDRSGSCPLNLSFSAYSTTQSIPVMEVLVSHAHHWQSIDLDFPLVLYRTLASLLDQTNRQLSTLHDLRVHVHDMTEPSVFGVNQLRTFQTARRLSALHLDWAIQGLFAIPYDQLTSLNVTCRTINDLLMIMQECSNLLNLNIIYDRLSAVTHSRPHNATIMLKLRFLRLYLSKSVNFGVLFDLITTPLLEELQIEDPYHLCPVWPLSSFISLVERSQCSIKKLHLSRLAINDEQLQTTLQVTPNLLELRLQERQRGPWERLTDRILGDLTNYDDESCLIPNLETIVIERRFTFSVVPFLKMLRSRWWTDECSNKSTRHVRRLIGVHFKPSGNKVKFKVHLDGLRKLQAEGLKVVFPPAWSA